MSLPSKYEPEFCQRIIPYFKQGMSISEICLELDIDRSCFYDYIRDHKEFAKAVKRGKAFSRGWWDREGRTKLESKEFNSYLWDRNMRNRFGCGEKKEIANKVESLIQKVIDDL